MIGFFEVGCATTGGKCINEELNSCYKCSFFWQIEFSSEDLFKIKMAVQEGMDRKAEIAYKNID